MRTARSLNRISSYPMHAPPRPPCTPPVATTHTPWQPHAPRQPHMPQPPGNHACLPMATTHTPKQPCMPPPPPTPGNHAHPHGNHACPPPGGQNHRRLWKYNLAPTSLRAVNMYNCEHINVFVAQRLFVFARLCFRCHYFGFNNPKAATNNPQLMASIAKNEQIFHTFSVFYFLYMTVKTKDLKTKTRKKR